MPSSMFTSMIWAPFSTCWRATGQRALVVPSLMSAGTARAGDVGALADVDEVGVGAGPQTARARRGAGGGAGGPARGATPCTASAMARMWSGVVPQQPPTMLTSPPAHSRSFTAISGALVVAAQRVGQTGIGMGADVHVSAMRAELLRRRRAELSAPRAQLSPMESGLTWRRLVQKASAVCPDKVRPLASVIVPEIMTGRRAPDVRRRTARWQRAPPWRSAYRRSSRPAAYPPHHRADPAAVV
jgi:hypothetical protein